MSKPTGRGCVPGVHDDGHAACSGHATGCRPGTFDGSPHSRALRLLMVTPRFFPLTGGVETHVYEVARRLVGRGAEVTVLTTDTTGELPAQESMEAIMVRRVRAWPANQDFRLAPAVYGVIRHGRWDLMHLQSYHTLVAPLAMLAARAAGLPYVVTFHPGGHSSLLRNRLRGPQQRLLRPLLAHAERLIAVAKFELEHFRRVLDLPVEQFVHIPNGSDLAGRLPSQPEQASPSGQSGPLIVSMGRLERYKGHHRVLAALPHVLAQEPGARLWIAGAGPEEDALRRQAEKLGVAEQVEIRAVPPSERSTLAAQLSRASLVALLSDYETHPIAAIEALALGRPLLVADSSGLAELAQQGLAQAVPLDSPPQAVANAALDLLHNPPPPRTLDLPTWDTCTEQLLELYQEVVRTR